MVRLDSGRQHTFSSVLQRPSTASSSIRLVVSTSTSPAPNELHFPATCAGDAGYGGAFFSNTPCSRSDT